MRPTTLDPTRMGCKAQDLEEHLRSRIVGQAEAVEQIANVYQMYVSGMTSPGRPIGTFLISCAGLEAVRRRFTPEFVNRLDTIVVFKPLGRTELRQVLEIELQGVQERIFQNLSDPFIFSVTDAGKEFLLREGTNLNYGARHLKRAIDRLFVHPMSNLIATGQILSGDAIRVDHPYSSPYMAFSLEGEGIPVPERARLGNHHLTQSPSASAVVAGESHSA